MNHIHHANALTVLKAQPFTAEEMNLIEAAAAALPWEDLSPMIEGLQSPATAESAKNAAYELIAETDKAHRGLAGMCVFAAAMYGSAKRFAALGVAHKVLHDTFCCLHRMAGEYRKEFGCLGFDRGFWIWRQACLRILRLGTLEYEYMLLSPWGAEETGLAEGTPVLSVHIPSGADLSREALDDSYQQARTLYPAHPELCPPDGKAPENIFCGSWLLCPTLRTLLKENSGIRRFAEDFDIHHVVEKSNGFRHFLFWAGEETPDADLPENTSLQRAVKAHLLSGGSIGSASGLLKR